jgi:putative ABC transport system substrate-binding protein
VTIRAVDVSRAQEIDAAMQALARQHVDVVIVLQTTLLLSLGRRIAELALAKRLPTIYGYREHVVAGGLVSYGVDLRWCYRRSAYFVHRILQGVPPGDLPVEFPNKIALSINLKTAKALTLKISEAFLLRADEVIE